MDVDRIAVLFDDELRPLARLFGDLLDLLRREIVPSLTGSGVLSELQEPQADTVLVVRLDHVSQLGERRQVAIDGAFRVPELGGDLRHRRLVQPA